MDGSFTVFILEQHAQTLRFSDISLEVQVSTLAVSLNFLSYLCSHWCLVSK